jgi:hypothetical protein
MEKNILPAAALAQAQEHGLCAKQSVLVETWFLCKTCLLCKPRFLCNPRREFKPNYNI